MDNVKITVAGKFLENSCLFPDKKAYVFPGQGEDAEHAVTYQELRWRVSSLAGFYKGLGLKDKRVILVYSDMLEFILSFLACQIAGAIPVPVALAKSSRQTLRLIRIRENAGASCIFCESHSVAHFHDIQANYPEKIDVIPTDLKHGAHPGAAIEEPDYCGTAFIQYTSGSTGDPKGVVVSQSNLYHNQQLIQRAFGCTEHSIIFSWLPFHHDMGLVGNILHTLYTGATCVLLSPADFLRRPVKWLEGISRYRCTHSGGPNFAYDHCVEKIAPHELTGLDLSCWKVAYNGSEPVGAETMKKFAARFSAAGFSGKAFHPCYGLAEATLLVSGEKAASPAEIFLVDGRTVVSSGSVAGGVDCRIISSTDQQELPDSTEGEICLAGDSITAGYLNTTDEHLFATIEGKKYLRTGDLGMRCNGELFVLGRIKELLIIRGRNIYPYDIERAIAAGQPVVELNGVALFPAGPAGDAFAVIVEIRRDQLKELDTQQVIWTTDLIVQGLTGSSPIDILLVPSLGIPRTTSGKLQRTKCRELYTRNAFSLLASKAGLSAEVQSVGKEEQKAQKVLAGGDPDAIADYLLNIIECKVGKLPPAAFIRQEEITQLGIDSLRLMELINTVNNDLHIAIDPARVLQDNRFQGLMALVEEGLRQKSGPAPIRAVPNQPDYAATDAQQRIWLLCQREGANAAYVIRTGLHLKGNIDVHQLKANFQWAIKRHEALRTVFREVDLHLRQVILQDIECPADIEDISDAEDKKKILAIGYENAAGWTFDPEQGPLLRVKIYILSPGEVVIVLGMHHLIADGWSVAILMKEVIGREVSFKADIAPLPVQYKDYAGWLAANIGGPEGEKAKDFWRGELIDLPDPLDLAADTVAGAARSFKGGSFKHYFGPGAWQQMRAYGITHKTTVFNFLRATVSLLLYKLSGQHDLIIGTPVACRNRTELEGQIGLYVNTIPLRIAVDPEDSFAGFLKKVTEHSARAFSFQQYPFDKIVEKAGAAWNYDGNPLFDVLLVVQDPETGSGRQTSTKERAIDRQFLDRYLFGAGDRESDDQPTQFDLSFIFANEPGGDLSLTIEYASPLYSKETIRCIFDVYSLMLAQVIQQPGQLIKDMEMVDGHQRQQLLLMGAGPEAAYPKEKTLVHLFLEQVRADPGKTALRYDGLTLTYQELQRRSDALACYLSAAYFIGPDDRIGIKLDRSEWLIISILAVLRSGGAYVPIDPEYPLHRVEFIISNSECKLVIDEEELRKFRAQIGFWETRSAANADLPEAPLNRPSDLAYVLYTSGSTGTPKGCMLQHQGVVNRLEWMWQQYGFKSADKILQKTSFTFDVSVWELFLPLCWGAELILCRREDAQSPERIAALIRDNSLTCLHFVPGMLQAFISDRKEDKDGWNYLKSLRLVITSGEALAAATVREWYKYTDIPIHNLYGPTEASIDVTFYPAMPNDTAIPIGRPIWNTQLYILGKENGLKPPGMPGEICIAGDGLARGYLNLPALTAERFVPDPFRKGEMMYKTGDIGRWLPDGNLGFMGRKDGQVKIRGFRIELGEIEARLLAYPDITSAVVNVTENRAGDKELRAWIIAKTQVQPADARIFLAAGLPPYMIPAHIVQLAAFPLTPNGKIDRKALQQQDDHQLSTLAEDYCAPQTATEQKLAEIWAATLDSKQIDLHAEFFDLGGNSLTILKLARRIHAGFGVKIPLNTLFKRLNLQAQARLIDQTPKTAYAGIVPAAIQPGYSLSAAQRRLWVLSQFAKSNIAYNMSGAFRMEGPVDKEGLEFAFGVLVQRHESLRTVFRVDGEGEIRQIILPPGTGLSLQYHDLTGEADPVTAANEAIKTQFTTPFDLTTGPLIRASLLKTEGSVCILSCVLHHIICDGWSIRILLKELGHIYTACIKGEKLDLPAARIQYKDYAAWQKGLENANFFQAHKEFWLKQFQGEIADSSLPGDKPRPTVKTFNGGVVQKRWDDHIYNAYKAYTLKQGATEFMGLMAAVKVLLFRYTRQGDVVIGFPVACREHDDLDNQIGLYANTLAIRTTITGATRFDDLLAAVIGSTRNALQYQAYPLDVLVDDLQLPHDPGRNPLFEVEVILNAPELWDAQAGYRLGEARMTGYKEVESPTSRFDLVFDFTASDTGLSGTLTFNSDIYSSEMAGQLLVHVEQIMQVVTANPEARLSQLDFLSRPEKLRLLEEFNRTQRDYGNYGTLTELFEAQVKRTPENRAIFYEGRQLTFLQLYHLSGRLAEFLRKEFSVGSGDRVGLMMQRSEFMVIAILGILRCGAAYVPLDPEYPRRRKKFMLENSGAKVLITSSEYILDIDYFDGGIFAMDIQFDSIDDIDRFADAACHPDGLAYVIHTSGSTGEPKGVAIQHRAIVNTIQSQIEIFGVKEGDRNLQFASLSFDASVSEIFVSLASGGVLYIIGEEQKRDARKFMDYIGQHAIDIATIPPAFLKLLDVAKLCSLKKMITAGEQVMPGRVSEFLRGGDYFNAYGPTEASICATIFQTRRHEEIRLDVPIGTPIGNTQVYILDDDMNLLPVGGIGEICVGGAGLSAGYLNSAGLTAEKFVANPFQSGELIYRTGDLGRWRFDGNIVFHGRKDQQVKIRGYRIDPAEIEEALEGHPGVDNAVVVARSNKAGEKELVAYIVSKEQPDQLQIGSYLAGILPSFMLPSHFVQLDDIPVTPHGKIDKKALPAPGDTDGFVAAASIDPAHPTQFKLAAIWGDILEKDNIGADSNFFELGGHSLKVIRLASLLYKEFTVHIEIKDLFSHPILRQQARLIELAQKTAFAFIPPAEFLPDYPLSPSQRRVWLQCQEEEINLAYNVSGAYVLEGVLNKEALSAAFCALIGRHESLRTTFREDDEGNIRQCIRAGNEVPFTLRSEDLRTEPGRYEQVKKSVHRDFFSPFSLGMAPLLRVSLYRLEDDKWIISCVMHHIISDGWSMEVLIRELLTLYRAKRGNGNDVLPPLRLQYKDYAVWKLDQLGSDSLAAAREYWLARLDGPIPVLQLPGARERPAHRTFAGRRVMRVIDPDSASRIKRLFLGWGGTLYMGLLSSVNALLFFHSGQEDIVVGSPVAGREHADLHDQIGFYVNTVALRTTLNGSDSFKTLFEKVKENTLAAVAYQAFPFDELVDALDIQWDKNRNFLFDVWMVLHTVETGGLDSQEVDGIKISSYREDDELRIKFDLLFRFIELADGSLQMIIEYNTGIIPQKIAEEMSLQLFILLGLLDKTSQRALNEIRATLGIVEKETQKQKLGEKRLKNLNVLKNSN